MKIGLGIDQTAVRELVKAFTNSPNHVLNDIKIEHGLDTGNFRNGGAWDVRFKRIKEVGLNNELVVLTAKRGIWTFICLLNLANGVLLVFSKEKNLESVIKKLGKKSIHYFHALVSINSDPFDLDRQQQELFPMFTEEYEARRLEEVLKILGEDYPKVKQVVFVVSQEVDRQVTGVEARLFNKYFELVDVEDWTSYVSEDYSDIFVSNEQDNDSDIETKPIAKIKDSIKIRRDYLKPTIPKKTDDTKKEEDLNQ
ncbi:DUF5986 family protein [Bacillus sp. FJAT-51639]|uniref:DUF5986 family protein n=1 Tax=Bacillus bruguierae TaxID=3127667 RepID=A0ABU8FB58_9BACI